MSVTPLRPAGTRPLRLGGAVFAALRAERGGAPDVDDEVVRSLAAASGLDEVALIEWERWASLGGLDGDARLAFLLACVVTGARAAGGSSVAPFGAPPTFRPFFDELARLTADAEGVILDHARIARGLACLDEERLSRPAPARVVGRADEGRPLVIEAETLSFHSLACAEATVASGLRSLLAREAPPLVDEAIARALCEVLVESPLVSSAGPMTLAPAQARAVASILCASFSVVAGGPGTGKTSIIATCVRAFARLGVSSSEIVLTAPTGRAALRMQESVRGALRTLVEPRGADRTLVEQAPRAETLHRLLGASRDGVFAHGPDAPLAARVVIVDEASMVSLPLFAALVRALPRDTPLHFVLVGDAHQLPSVEAGDVLSAITRAGPSIPRALNERIARVARIAQASGVTLPIVDASGPVVDDRTLAGRTVWLDVVHRQADDAGGRAIAALAEHLRAGRDDEALAAIAVRESADTLTELGVDLLPWRGDDDDVLAQVAARVAATHASTDDEREALATGFEPDDPQIASFVARRLATRILCFTHHGRAGDDALNLHIARAREGARARAAFAFAGAPVLVVENDPVTGLMNGDVGVVVPVRDGGHAPTLRAAFLHAGSPTLLALSRLPPARLAYATTVHKAQGTECERVVVVLPDDGPLLARETLYTAITRARRCVWLLGSTDDVRRALGRSMARLSRLADRVAGPTTEHEG